MNEGVSVVITRLACRLTIKGLSVDEVFRQLYERFALEQTGRVLMGMAIDAHRRLKPCECELCRNEVKRIEKMQSAGI